MHDTPPDPKTIAEAVRVLRQIGAVDEVALIRHMLSATGARKEEFVRLDKELVFDAKLLETVHREWVAKGNARGLVRRAIDESLERFRGRPLPRYYAAEIKRELEARLGHRIRTSQICARRSMMFPPK